MPTEDSGTIAVMAELEELTVEACWERLRSSRLGRIAFVHGGRPEILPVNYATEGEEIVFRTASGSPLAHVAGSHVAFEIDGYDEAAGDGWSVMARGVAQDIDETIDSLSESLRRLTVQTAAPGARHHWMAVYVDAVSGRSFRGGATAG
jgi:uncharacterized protein